MADTSTREREMERAAEVMREFMARAVLFQDAVAKWGGVNGTDLQCASPRAAVIRGGVSLRDHVSDF